MPFFSSSMCNCGSYVIDNKGLIVLSAAQATPPCLFLTRHNYRLSTGTQARLRSGNAITDCASRDCLALSSISARRSRKIALSSALTNSSIAAFQETLASFRCLLPLSKLANWLSINVLSDAFNRNSSGRFTGISPAGLGRALLAEVRL